MRQNEYVKSDKQTDKQCSSKSSGKTKRTRLVVEENTVYEIDLDCYECKKREEKS